MKFNKIILLSTLLILGLIYYLSFNYIYNTATADLINKQIENSKIQADIISSLLSEKLISGYSKEEVKNELQRSIENSPIENSFICMFDDTGKEICHPDRERIGKTLTKNNSILTSIPNQKIEKNFKESIIQKVSIGGLRETENYTEIVYLSPVKNTDWIVASHSNILKFKDVLDNLKEKLSFIFILVWLGSSLLIYFFLQFINSKSLEKITELNRETSAKYFNELKKLNKNISKTTNSDKSINDRFLADKGIKLTPVYIDNIAIIYTENKITNIVEHNNEKSSINLTLDELFKSLNPKTFYRASRQVIISAKAINKIEKYGNAQLKVETKPISPITIIISKAKITEFKKWAGKN
ncbi:LytTR family transcriptional regulator [Aquimarina sp. MAR_2010_214]|uniref:LytTR family transcriptional regulator DNA-binding domain-containing protein n=1 Tax=Aquimarina sp. MAR_2010_214 TaxID=1250026 RepID=UPI000C700FDB|nr:LytTR family transcriptional regulator DNA-binding domain-containing protein [Aquimarina sp. MAR_2010_214]PKV50932.1 LytTR family transcriptional regulator [Aquimarina sp. MAR_2010_214]